MSALRDIWRTFNQGVDELLERFHKFAADLDRRRERGDFGKWPWQR